MNIKFPIFLKDRDGYVYVVKSYDDIKKEVELIDVEEGEYIVWDSNGRLLEFYILNGEIKVRILDNEAKEEDLKKAILNYAEKFKVEKKNLDDFLEKEPFVLFMEVEKLIKDKKFLYKIKSFFSKVIKNLGI